MWQYLGILREKGKKKFFRRARAKIQVFYTPNRKCNSKRGFYCIFMWQYLDILGEKAKKKIFYKALERKNSSIPSPDRIFNSWQGFYCSFMWQYLAILGEKAKKIYFTRLLRGKLQVFQAPTGYSTADKAFIADLCDNLWTF